MFNNSQWIPYNNVTKKQLKCCTQVAVKTNNGSNKVLTSRESIQPYINYDYSSLIQSFKLL